MSFNIFPRVYMAVIKQIHVNELLKRLATPFLFYKCALEQIVMNDW